MLLFVGGVVGQGTGRGREKTKTYLLLLPNVIIDSHFAPLPLLPPPLFGMTTDVVQLLVGHLQVVGEEEVHLFAMETPKHIQHAAIVVQPVECNSCRVVCRGDTCTTLLNVVHRQHMHHTTERCA